MPKQTTLILGHSFVTRLAAYAARYHLCGLNLRSVEHEIIFHGIPGATLLNLSQEIDRVRTLRPTIVFLEVGTNDLCSRDPDSLALEVISFARTLLATYGVQEVSISQVIYRDPSRGGARTPSDFNDRVARYNAIMKDLTAPIQGLRFWKHRGIWTQWMSLLSDGIHYNQRGMRKYFNSVRGSVIAMSNTICHTHSC